MRKINHYILTGRVACESGLRIGGGSDVLQIGGADLTIVKHPVTLQPYIPGSSLKGKMRSEAEKTFGLFGGRDNNQPFSGGNLPDNDPETQNAADVLCRVFGPHAKTDHGFGPPRIIVRDCHLLDGGRIENIAQTGIDRATGAALRGSLRTMERVTQGTMFGFEIGIQVYDDDARCELYGYQGEKALLYFVSQCLQWVTATGLGSGTSRGSGKVVFIGVDDAHPKPTWKKLSHTIEPFEVEE